MGAVPAAEAAQAVPAATGANAGRPLAAYDVLSPECPSRTVLRHVVDRWTPLIVAVLAQGPRRFGELRQAVGGVTPKVLAQTLRSMERDGLVLREQTPGVPPRVDYTLTPLGAGLAEPIAALRAWAEGNAEQVLAHREAYDRAHPQSEE
ncbi:helix-turn-helix transcriptional regulator [Actinomyces sp. 594]|nr:helix-turn-helix transcriptional regulator [Actinomyces sp. 594]